MLKCPAAGHRPPTARFLPAALTASLIALLGCGGGGPAGPSVVVQSIKLTPAADTALIGQRVVLTAGVTAEGAAGLGPALMHWSAAPSVPLSVAPSGLTAELTPQFPGAYPGAYEITVQAADKTAHATVTVLGFPLDSPLLGQWRLTALRLRPTSGAEPEPVPFVSGVLIVNAAGSLAFSVLSPEASTSDSGTTHLDYPVAWSVDGSRLFMCWERDPDLCTTAQATVAPDGTRLSIVGPFTGFFFPPSAFKYGTPEWEFQR